MFSFLLSSHGLWYGTSSSTRMLAQYTFCWRKITAATRTARFEVVRSAFHSLKVFLKNHKVSSMHASYWGWWKRKIANVADASHSVRTTYTLGFCKFSCWWSCNICALCGLSVRPTSNQLKRTAHLICGTTNFLWYVVYNIVMLFKSTDILSWATTTSVFWYKKGCTTEHS